MKRYFARFFHAPDDGGAQVAIPADQSPTGVQIDITPRTPPPPPEIHQLAPEQSKPEPKVRQPGVKLEKADVIKELGLAEAPSESVKRLAEIAREKATGRFAKKDADPAAEPAPKKPAAAKPKAKVEAPPVAPQPDAPPEKVKIGDKEYTQAELAEIIAKTTEPPAKDEKPGDGKTVIPPAKAEEKQDEQQTDEETIAAQQKTEQEWLNRKVSEFKPDAYGIKLGERELDTILSGGPRAVTAFAQILARVAAASELNARKWAAKHLSDMRGEIQPEIEQRATIQKYQAEHSFLAANPDIAAHKDAGVKAMREAAAELHEQYDALTLAVSQNPANAWAKAQVEKLEKDFLGEVAKATKAKLAGTAPAVPATGAKPAVAKARPPAPTGNVGAGHGAPVKKSSASGEIAELMQAGLS